MYSMYQEQDHEAGTHPLPAFWSTLSNLRKINLPYITISNASIIKHLNCIKMYSRISPEISVPNIHEDMSYNPRKTIDPCSISPVI